MKSKVRDPNEPRPSFASRHGVTVERATNGGYSVDVEADGAALATLIALVVKFGHTMSGNTVPPPTLRVIPLDRIQSHPDCVATGGGSAENAELIDSMGELGFLCPVVVTPDVGGLHTLIDGHRRVACAKALGLTAVPCLVLPALSPGEYLQRRFHLNTLTRPWTQAEMIPNLVDG